MRFHHGTAAGLIAVGLITPTGLAGCTGTDHAPGAARPSSAAPVRLAAEHYYAVSAAGQFAASWRLLTPAARRVIPQGSWTGVHRACPSAGASEHRIIKSVTFFGNTAIVVTTIAGAPKKTGVLADVFSFADGHWAYSPGDPGVYGRGSVSADTAVARKAGLCGGWKNF